MSRFFESLGRFGAPESLVFVIAAWVVVVLGVVVFVAALGLLTHHVVTDRRRARDRAYRRRAAAVLVPKLSSGQPVDEAARESASRWGMDATASVLRRARIELKGPISEEISRVLEELGEIDRLAKLSRTRKPWRRANALRELGECGGPRARERLIEATQDPEPSVRRVAREGLLIDRGPEGVKAAIQSYLLDAPTRSAWRRAFYARLAAVASEELRELLVGGRLDWKEEKLALEALGDAGDRESRSIATKFAASPQAELRATAIRVLGKLQDESSQGLMLDLLDDPEWFVRAAAARALGSIPCSEDCCLPLEEKLTDPEWWVRANAAKALSRQGDTGVEVLLRSLDKDDRYARHAALTALAYVDLSAEQQAHLDRRLDDLPSDGLDETAVSFLRSNLALERA